MAKGGALIGAIVSLAIFAAPVLAGAGGSEQSVHVRGSSIFLPAMQILAEHYMADHPGSRIVVTGGGSWWGVKTVLDGTAALGMLSGEAIPGDLDELAKEEGETLHRHSIARFAVAPVVHPGNPVTGLTLAQLHDIYVGRIANWKEVGGPNAPIHVVAAEDVGAGTFQVWAGKVLGSGAVATPSARTVAAARMGETVAKDPLAIGYEALGRLGPGLKPLKIDGVEAREDSIADGRWPVTGEIGLTYLDPLPDSAKAFLAYCLGEAGKSEAGRIRAVFIADRAEETR